MSGEVSRGQARSWRRSIAPQGDWDPPWAVFEADASLKPCVSIT